MLHFLSMDSAGEFANWWLTRRMSLEFVLFLPVKMILIQVGVRYQVMDVGFQVTDVRCGIISYMLDA